MKWRISRVQILLSLAALVYYYNNRRYSVLTLSPNDAKFGKIYDTEKYIEKLKQARIRRIEENKACNKCDFTL